MMEFCRLTYSDLKLLMKRRQSELTHNLIIFALQRTLAFEANLNKTCKRNLLKQNEDHFDYHNLKSSIVKQSTNPFDEDVEEEEVDEDRSKNDKIESEMVNNQQFDGVISRFV